MQLYTGFIYGGPETASAINERLLELMEQNRYEHLADAVGSAATPPDITTRSAPA